MTDSQRIDAPAKLTLALRVTGVRADGYHLLDAEMVSLGLHDTLTFSPAEHISLDVSGPRAEGVPRDASNLVWRALELAGRTAHVAITKRVPNGGGLGGGSSDAAAVLRWAGWVPTPEALVLAATLGADVPYCLAGGHARVRGIGEIIDPAGEPGWAGAPVTLVVPPLHVSTPAVYQAWDVLGGPTADGPNDLEPAAVHIYPELEHWRDRIAEACGRAPHLAGSGATWFVVGEHGSALAALRDEGAHVITTHIVG